MDRKYICVLHGRTLRVVKNGVYVEQLDGYRQPYKIYSADVWACPEASRECGYDLLVTAPLPVAEAFQEEAYARYKEHVTVTFVE